MEKYFQKQLGIVCKTSKTKYVLVNSIILKYLPMIFVVSIINEIICRSSKYDLSKIIFLISCKIVASIIIGLISGILEFNLYDSLIKKSLDRKHIKRMFILIYGVIGFGLTIIIATAHYPLNLQRIFFRSTSYLLIGLSIGLVVFEEIKSSISKYSKNISEQFN